jgi:hypothetical protein
VFVVSALVGSVGSIGAQTTVLTVGPHGSYPTIQNAIDLVVPGTDTEIRVEGGATYVENLVIDAGFSSGTLALLGVWETTFSQRPFPPQDTIIDGGLSDGVIDAFGMEGDLTIDGFTVTNGLKTGGGGGIHINPSGDAHVTLDNVRIIDNTATAAGGTSGGGLRAELSGSQHLEVLNCRISGNGVSSSAGGVVTGGGVALRSIGDSSFVVQGCEIDNNSLESTGQVQAAGIWVRLEDSAQGNLLDNTIVANSAHSSDVWVSGLQCEITDSGTLNVERSAVALNTATGGGAGPQVWSANSQTSSLRMSDSIVGLGDQDGLEVRADHTSTANLVNLTVVDNAGNGVAMGQFGSATMTLYNTIVYGNLVDFSIINGSVETESNLIGVDPGFVNPAALDYELGLGSPAENAGDNNAPGGLGLLDLGGNTRVQDSTVDIGCYEGIAEIFFDGFENGQTTAWSP